MSWTFCSKSPTTMGLRRDHRRRRCRLGRVATWAHGQEAQPADRAGDGQPQRGRTATQAFHPGARGLALQLPARAAMAQSSPQRADRARARASRQRLGGS